MTQINEVMSKDFKFITPDTTVQDAAKLMQELDIGFIPVGENDRLIGAITDRDIAVRSSATGANPAEQAVRDVLTAKTFYCFDDQDIDAVCENMAEIKVRRLPVVNRDKRLVGIVSLGDLSQACHRAKAGDTLQEITHCGELAKAA